MHFPALVRVGVGLSRRLEEQQVGSAGQWIGNIWSRLTCILLVLAEAHIYDMHFYNDLKFQDGLSVSANNHSERCKSQGPT